MFIMYTSQGINGILADEMGLGKTVQSIAFLSYLAEVCTEKRYFTSGFLKDRSLVIQE